MYTMNELHRTNSSPASACQDASKGRDIVKKQPLKKWPLKGIKKIDEIFDTIRLKKTFKGLTVRFPVHRLREVRYYLGDRVLVRDKTHSERPVYERYGRPYFYGNGIIHKYNYKPEPIFYGEGSRYFGVELEIDGAGESDGSAAALMDIANRKFDRLYCKHDGSLNDGIELVSHPMSLKYHQEEMPWEAILKEAADLGYLSHQSSTCGLHVHVNRTAFGSREQDQETVIARILFFVENHWNELLRFSRRTQRQMDRWAARYGRKDDPKAFLDQAKSRSMSRYTCVNLTNCATVEFRMFRGTLKLNTFLATLQMVSAICDVALLLSDSEVQALTWSEFVTDYCKSPELIQYLKERRLYVSDPVETEVEI